MLRLRSSILFSFIFSILLSGCVSNTKRIAQIDAAISDRPQLNHLCSEGVSGACALAESPAQAIHHLPILQGVTSLNQSRLVVVTPKRKTFSFYVVGKGLPEKLTAETSSYKDADLITQQVEVFGLVPQGEYELLVLGPDGQLWDRRKFRSLDTGKKNARVALVSCMDDSFREIQKQIWPELLEQKPDAILLIGDNTYVDLLAGVHRPVTDPQQIWDRYVQTRERLELFKADRLIPVVAVWDDHDYGKNDGDRTFAFKEESTRVFFSFFPQSRPAPGFERGPGVASWWTAFGVEFGLLDDRSFRSPNQVDSADQTHFGLDQEKWVTDRLKANEKPILLASGDQFFGGYHSFESFEGSHPISFKKQIGEWRKYRKAPLLFLSGDRHLSEIIRVPSENLGFETYEVTSSGIHAKVFDDALKRAPSPLQLAGQAGAYNFAILQIQEVGRKKLTLDVTSFGLGRKTLFQKTLTVKGR